jgi:hypothetical protein
LSLNYHIRYFQNLTGFSEILMTFNSKRSKNQ